MSTQLRTIPPRLDRDRERESAEKLANFRSFHRAWADSERVLSLSLEARAVLYALMLHYHHSGLEEAMPPVLEGQATAWTRLDPQSARAALRELFERGELITDGRVVLVVEQLNWSHQSPDNDRNRKGIANRMEKLRVSQDMTDLYVSYYPEWFRRADYEADLPEDLRVSEQVMEQVIEHPSDQVIDQVIDPIPDSHIARSTTTTAPVAGVPDCVRQVFESANRPLPRVMPAEFRDLLDSGVSHERIAAAARVMLALPGLDNPGLRFLAREFSRFDAKAREAVSSTYAEQRWDLYRARDLTRVQNQSQFTATVERVVADGDAPSVEAFRAELGVVKPWDIAGRAQTRHWAVAEVARRLATLNKAA